jgi:hypothetical protein
MHELESYMAASSAMVFAFFFLCGLGAAKNKRRQQAKQH